MNIQIFLAILFALVSASKLGVIENNLRVAFGHYPQIRGQIIEI